MIVNSSLTIYHKSFDEDTRLEKWIRFNYGDEDNDTVWFFGGRGAGISKGYKDANDVEIRLPYDLNKDLNVKNFAIGDIIVQGYLTNDISTQNDLDEYQIFNITSINNNNFGINQHIHIGGK